MRNSTSIAALAALVAFARLAHAQTVATAVPPISDSLAVYRGVYTSSPNESIFSPCDVRDIGSGWSLRFNNERHGAFLRFPYA